VKKTLIAALVAGVLAAPAVIAADYSVSAGAHAASAKHGVGCIHEISLGLRAQPTNKVSGVSADLASLAPVGAADSGVVLAVCDSCHVQTGVNEPYRSSSIGAGTSNKMPNECMACTESASSAFEVGWRSDPTDV
jgi:hypothetical protein